MSTLAVRQQVVELCHELAARGYFAATGGNIALRIDEDSFAVTPSATDYDTMRPEDVCVLRLRDRRQIQGNRPPSVESDLHARILRARPDCHCSTHTHQPLASACALLSRPIGHVALNVAIVGYAPSGTRWLAPKLAKALRPDINAYLMRNHGAVCCGPDATTTMARIADLESWACEYLRSRIQAHAETVPSQRPVLQRILENLP
jgi:L-fuculose-phosphate aldolase